MNRYRLWTATLTLVLAATLPLSLAQQPAKAPAKEQSVKPGINEQWKSPNVEPLIGTLEAESREIYRQREDLAALVGPLPGMVVADVGAGSGFMAEQFARLVGEKGKVFAVDINAKLLEHIAQRAQQNGLRNIQTVLAREDSVELPASSVDLVFICDTYHHFEYPRSTMASIHRALRPDGQLVLVDFRRIPGKSRQFVFDHVRAGQEEVIRELTSFGFQLTNLHDVTFLPENYIARFRKVETPR